jgi:glutamine cyclotransferase
VLCRVVLCCVLCCCVVWCGKRLYNINSKIYIYIQDHNHAPLGLVQRTKHPLYTQDHTHTHDHNHAPLGLVQRAEHPPVATGAIGRPKVHVAELRGFALHEEGVEEEVRPDLMVVVV